MGGGGEGGGLLVILGPSLGPCRKPAIEDVTIFYYILDIEMTSQSLSNFFMEL